MKREPPSIPEAADEGERDAAGPQPELGGTVSMRRDLPLMYGAQALRYLAPTILVPFYGRALGIESYGHLLLAMALMQIVWVIVEWGLPSTGSYEVATATSAAARGQLLGTQTAGRLLLALVVAPVALAAILLTPALNGDVVVSVLALSLGVASAFNMTWYFQGVGLLRMAAIIEVLGMALSTSLILWWVRSPTDTWIIPAVLLGVGVGSSAIQFCLAASPLPAGSIKCRRPLQAIRSSTLLFVDRGQTMLLGPICIFLLGFVAPASAVTALAVADRLMGVALALLNPINQVFSPQLARSVARMRLGAPAGDTHLLIRKVCWYSMGLYVLIASAGLALADHLIPLIFGPGYESVIAIFRTLCVTLLVLGSVSVLISSVLYPFRYDRDVALLSSVRLLSSCIFVVSLGVAGGAMGAALGRMLGAMLTLALLIIIFKRRSLSSIFL